MEDVFRTVDENQPTLLELEPAQTRASFTDALNSHHSSQEFSAGRILLHAGLLLLTILTTSIAGGMFPLLLSQDEPFGSILQDQAVIARIAVNGLLFSFTLLTILTSHELGHFFACRYYGVRATLPYFIPAPVGIGTFGAFIRIKSPIPSRRALFDIGIAGPLAGFLFVLPAAFIGLLTAAPAPPVVQSDSLIVFQDPLLFVIISKIFHLPQYTEWNPVYFAAWVGCLATGLNLLPVGQLDGGHVVYSLFGRTGHRSIAWLFYAGMAAVALYGSIYRGWYGGLLYLVVLTVMLAFKHPPTMVQESEIGTARKVIALVGLIVFLLSFLPLPVTNG